MVWYQITQQTYIVVIAHVFRLTFSSTHLVVSLIRLVVTEHTGRKQFDGMVRYGSYYLWWGAQRSLSPVVCVCGKTFTMSIERRGYSHR